VFTESIHSHNIDQIPRLSYNVCCFSWRSFPDVSFRNLKIHFLS